jgi:hypothetical protein
MNKQTPQELEKPELAKPIFRVRTVTEMLQQLYEQVEQIRIVQTSMQEQLNDLWKKQIEVVKL